MIRVHIKRSKTDPFRKGINLFVGKTGTALCPLAALLGYLLSCCMDPGPLFRYEDGRPLTRPRFTEAIRSVLGRAGVDQKIFLHPQFSYWGCYHSCSQRYQRLCYKNLRKVGERCMFASPDSTWQTTLITWGIRSAPVSCGAAASRSNGTGPLIVLPTIACVCIWDNCCVFQLRCLAWRRRPVGLL